MRCRNRVLAALGCVFLLLGILACGGYYCARRYSYPLSAFQDCAKFYTDFTDSSLDVVNLGSTTGKYAFDWSGMDVKGGNFATAPQCGTYDFALLKEYRRFIAPGAVILITMCPFSNICPKDYPMPRKDWFAKYYALLNRDDLTYYSYTESLKVWLSLNLRHMIWMRGFPSDASLGNCCGSNAEKRKGTADGLRRAWMKQFDIEDLSLPVPKTADDNLVWNVRLYRDMIDWCISCGFQPVLIFPPLSREFDIVLSDSFLRNYVYGFVREINRGNVPYYDYIRDSCFRADEDAYFMDGFRLSKKGRKVFTQMITDRLRADGLLRRK